MNSKRSLFLKDIFEILLLIYGLIRLFLDSLFLSKRLLKEKAQSFKFSYYRWFWVVCGMRCKNVVQISKLFVINALNFA